MGSIDKKTRLQIFENINQISCKNNASFVSTECITRDSPLIFICIRWGIQFYDKWGKISFKKKFGM